jgi:hypothetical protein
MKIRNRSIHVAALLILAFISYGCTRSTPATSDTAKSVAPVKEQQQKTTYAGSIVGKSNKARTISIKTGGEDGPTMMVKFDDKTQGVDFAEKGEAAIITWEQRGEDKFATMITPKLAKLPDGVTEIKVEEIHQLISNGTPMTLVDARPESRYDQAHLPGAISIPVPKLKKMQAAVLSDDKDKLLLFYCGGPT